MESVFEAHANIALSRTYLKTAFAFDQFHVAICVRTTMIHH